MAQNTSRGSSKHESFPSLNKTRTPSKMQNVINALDEESKKIVHKKGFLGTDVYALELFRSLNIPKIKKRYTNIKLKPITKEAFQLLLNTHKQKIA